VAARQLPGRGPFHNIATPLPDSAAAHDATLPAPSLQFAERYDAHSYGSLIRRALGRKTAASLSAIMLIYLIGSCIAYLVRGALGQVPRTAATL
jgi:carbon starvation protein CstA